MFPLRDGDYIEVTPAYGRDYKNKKEIEEDLLKGNDFVITSRQTYINIAEMRKHDFKVIVRYGKLMKNADMTYVLKKK